MTWLAPWALVGLAAVALPVLVHWLARHQAARRVFPTVRFLPKTPPTSVRRHQLTDLALLAVRVAIVAAGAAALARLALLTPPAPGDRPARAIVVDTSASMARAGAAAETAVAALGAAPADIVIRTPDLRHGVAQAGAWLRARSGAGELVVVSDFQVGAIVEADFDVVPAWAGRRLVRVAAMGAVPAPAGAGTVRVYGAPAAAAAARAVTGMSGAIGAAPAIVIAFERAPEFAALKAGAQPIDTPALYHLASKMSSEAIFGKIASELILLSDLPPDSVEAAALIARALRAAADSPVSLAEQEPDTLAAAIVDAWQRDPRVDLAPAVGDPSPLHRWMWGLVLTLLLIEAWVRRGRRPAAVPTSTEEVTHARVA